MTTPSLHHSLPPVSVYTAAQLARAAGISKRTLLAELKAAPRSVVIASGNPAHAWALADLPDRHQAAIEANAHGLPAHIFLATAPALWHLVDPTTKRQVPLSEIADKSIAKAATLRLALARVLELRNNPVLSAAQLEAIGLEDYRREFGHSITSRTFRALMKRTLERDRGFENWNRLDIYLDGNPQRKAHRAPTAAVGVEFQELHDTLASFKSAVQPSTREREGLWMAALKLFERQTRNGADEKRTRIALIRYLWTAAPWIARSKNALRVAFVSKYERWLETGRNESALRDGREAKRGIPTAAPIPQALIDNVVACATFRTGGRVSQAVREVSEMAGQLGIGEDLAQLLAPESGNKSFVNRRLREAVRHEVRNLAPYVIGSRALDSARASLNRSYENIPSGYCYSSDDVTLPVYWYVPDGNGWFKLVRGQCLITIDARTLCILGFSLQPDRNYSSPVIHTNFTRVFSDWGVPRKLYLERGIWKNSKLITGGPKAQTNHQDYQFMPFSRAETERGFGDLGVTFLHAIRARSKVVESVMRLIQAYMEGEPGYCGRDERHDCPADTKRQMDDVKFKRIHPSKHFYDFDQWEARLVEISVRYNGAIQQGKMLDGMSPAEAQEKLQSPDEDKRPLLFDYTCRHLLAPYRVAKKAGKDGFDISIGRKKWNYRSKELSAHKGREMLCWFNPDEPSSLAVTDMNMRNSFGVPLSNSVAALPEFNESPDALAMELARVADYESYGKARYQVLKANFAPKFRRMVPNRAIIETGQAMRQQREVIEVERKRAIARKQTGQRNGRALGLPASIINPGEDGAEGTRMMLEAKRAHERNTASLQDSITPTQENT